jgi:hypothetical protein
MPQPASTRRATPIAIERCWQQVRPRLMHRCSGIVFSHTHQLTTLGAHLRACSAPTQTHPQPAPAPAVTPPPEPQTCSCGRCVTVVAATRTATAAPQGRQRPARPPGRHQRPRRLQHRGPRSKEAQRSSSRRTALTARRASSAHPRGAFSVATVSRRQAAVTGDNAVCVNAQPSLITRPVTLCPHCQACAVPRSDAS